MLEWLNGYEPWNKL